VRDAQLRAHTFGVSQTMIPVAKNKFFAILVYIFVNLVVYFRGVDGQLETSIVVLSGLLFVILTPGIEAWFASWGFMEGLAKDSGSSVSPGLVSLFYWLLFIIASLYFLFNWSLY